MHASVGVSAGRNGNDASRPRTKNTCSPTPAPIESSATSVRPVARRSGVTGWSTRSLWPTSAASLTDATTDPTTRAICTAGSLLYFDLVDDADDGGINRTVFQAGRHAGGTAAHDQHG